MVVHDTAVRTYRNVNTGLLVIFISCRTDIDQRRCLTAPDSLCLTRNADGAAADTDFDKIRAAFGKKTESGSINHISSANFNTVAVIVTDPFQCDLLPF